MSPVSDPLARFRLDGKIVLITGASSGLGAHFAGVVASAGGRSLLAARRADRLNAVAADIPGAIALPCDISAPDQAQELIHEIESEHGSIDVLVNNAGISDGGTDAENESMEEFNRVLQVNLSALFHLSTLVAPSMIRRNNGCIVNIASIHGLCAGAPNDQAAYVASKAGVVGLTRELAVQWARFGIRVNAIAPAYFETELTTEMMASERSRQWIERNTPMRRSGRIDELDGALLFLASEASSYVTGTTVVVDGGWTAR